MSFPEIGDEFGDWGSTVTFKVMVQTIVNHKAVNTPTTSTLDAMMWPLKAQEIAAKPEGQRAWRWLKAVSETTVAVNSVIQDPDGVNYKVMAVNNWGMAGFYEYDIAEAFQ